MVCSGAKNKLEALEIRNVVLASFLVTSFL